MEKIIGYARIVARIRIKEQINKPLLGKPYLKYGQCHGLWGYFFHVGGILGARHATDLDAFGHAFLGTFGPAVAVKEYFTDLSKRLMADFLRDSMTFADYVGAEFIARVGYVGDSR